MNDRPPATAPSTAIPLIVLTLVVGVALGWLLRDLLRSPDDQLRPTPLAGLPSPAASPPPTPAVSLTPPPATAAPARPTALPATAAPPTAPPPTAEPPTAAPPTPPPPTAIPPTAIPPTASPAPDAQIVGYAGHIVVAGETLETIAANGGSTPALISSYNLLDGPPQPGRALIVPRIAGQSAVLESAPILVRRGPSGQPWVALTLDAGASADPLPRILQTLRAHHVTITFFLTGQWIKDNPELTRQIVADGHEIANHSFNHPDLTHLDDQAIRAELADTEALLQQTAGVSSRPFFRPPYGAYDEHVLGVAEGEGYLPIYWTLDSLDSVGEPKTPAFLLERVTAKLTPEQLRGAIILAHCGSDATADALPQILDRFAEMGFEVRKLSEVLGG